MGSAFKRKGSFQSEKIQILDLRVSFCSESPLDASLPEMESAAAADATRVREQVDKAEQYKNGSFHFALITLQCLKSFAFLQSSLRLHPCKMIHFFNSKRKDSWIKLSIK